MDITKPQNDIRLLEQTTLRKVQCFLDHARKLGLDIFIFETKRTFERQEWLLGRGRSAAELKQYNVPVEYAKPVDANGKANKQRTRTLDSKHLVGQAVDIVFDVNIDPKIQVPSWNGDYMTLIKIGKMYGLRNLAPAETCHFENDGRTIPQVIKDNSTVWNNSNDQWMKDQLHIANQNLRGNQ